MLQLKTDALMATPCDDEEDNMAMLCCHGKNGEMFMLTRYPDEDEVELTWDYEPSTLDGLKVTLGDTTLLIELAAGDADALGGRTNWRSPTAPLRQTWPKCRKRCRTSSQAPARSFGSECTVDPMWELACSRRRPDSQHSWICTYPLLR